jgi:hypothetical protein
MKRLDCGDRFYGLEKGLTDKTNDTEPFGMFAKESTGKKGIPAIRLVIRNNKDLAQLASEAKSKYLNDVEKHVIRMIVLCSSSTTRRIATKKTKLRLPTLMMALLRSQI